MCDNLRFVEDQEIGGLIFEDDSHILLGKNCEKIVVVMESGQMAAVPWFAVYIDGVVVSKVNATFCQSIITIDGLKSYKSSIGDMS